MQRRGRERARWKVAERRVWHVASGKLRSFSFSRHFPISEISSLPEKLYSRWIKTRPINNLFFTLISVSSQTHPRSYSYPFWIILSRLVILSLTVGVPGLTRSIVLAFHQQRYSCVAPLLSEGIYNQIKSECHHLCQ